jgi:chromosome segregation ATPase
MDSDVVAKILDANVELNARIAKLEAENANLKAEKAASEAKDAKKRKEMLEASHSIVNRQARDVEEARNQNTKLLAEINSLRIAAQDDAQVAAKLERIEIEMRDGQINALMTGITDLKKEKLDLQKENDGLKETLVTIQSVLSGNEAVITTNKIFLQRQNEVNILNEKTIQELRDEVQKLTDENQILCNEQSELNVNYMNLISDYQVSEYNRGILKMQLE